MFIRHEITKIPKDIAKETVIQTCMGLITSLGFDLLAFSLQLGKEQVTKGNIILGLVFISLYYIQRTLEKTINLWFGDIKASYREHYETTISNRIVKILLKDTGKVYRENSETKNEEVMNTNTLLLSTKNYISEVWRFKTEAANRIFQVVSLIILMIGFVKVTNVELQHVWLFFSIIFLTTIFVSVFCYKRIKFRKAFRKKRKLIWEKKDKYLDDVLHIEPISEKHAEVMSKRYISASTESFGLDRKQRKGINKINFFESLLTSIATIAIIFIKVWETGLKNVDLTVVLSIIAIVAIYSQIMGRVSSIIRTVEDVKGNIEEIENYTSDFQKIISVYDQECSEKEGSYAKLESLEIPKFSVQYRAKKGDDTPFTLKNNQNMKFIPGDMVLFIGPTGSGKSTLLKMVANILKFNNFNINYTKSEGSVNVIMHQTDSRLGSDSVLREIVLDNSFDENKLIDILKGLQLYDVLKRKDSDIWSYLDNSKYEDFSSGQKQRLVLARLLYNLDESVQIVVFDEATNALNDDICRKVMQYLKLFCKDKIVFFATHQVPIGKEVATSTIEFIENSKVVDCFECIQSK